MLEFVDNKYGHKINTHRFVMSFSFFTYIRKTSCRIIHWKKSQPTIAR